MKKLPPPRSSTPPMIAAHLRVGSSCFVYPRGRSSPSSPPSPLSRDATLERRVDAEDADGRPSEPGRARRELDDEALEARDVEDDDDPARVLEGGRMPDPEPLLAAGAAAFAAGAWEACGAGAGAGAGFAIGFGAEGVGGAAC